ncbi:MAG: hypothetical protein CL878_09345 [Dehalococcoidia bacterium]|nr:hypothetical protein [Dehalococcoidia bacterium]
MLDIPVGLTDNTPIAAVAAGVAARVRRSVVEIRTPAGSGGAGTAWRSDDMIVTNRHVVTGNRARVRAADGRTFAAEVAARDDANDIAVLKAAGARRFATRDRGTAFSRRPVVCCRRAR